MDDEEEENGCGLEWDHVIDWGDPVDGMRVGICRLCGAELIEDEEDDGEPYIRVSGDMVCEQCGLPYWRHPQEILYDAFDGQELYLRRLCDGRLGKT